MKKNFQELLTKDKEELEKMVENLKKELLKLRIDLSQGKIKNFAKIRQIKKDIARCFTALRQKEK
jgi:large subunit ribosomal protein L29